MTAEHKAVRALYCTVLRAASSVRAEGGIAIRNMQDQKTGRGATNVGAHLREGAQSLAVMEKFSPKMRIYP